MGKQNAIRWTAGQLDAINARGCTLLVSAAAGSGKTAVLTNRIINKIIEDKCEITDFLVVTFTRAAASEMKNKIVKALRDKSAQNPADRHLRRQISRIGEARISTIDSFYTSVIKDNFNILGLPAKMRLMDEAESRVFMNRKVNEVMEKFYAEYDSTPASPFHLVAEALSGARDDEGFANALTDIYKAVNSFPQPSELLIKINRRLESEIEAYYRGEIGVFETYWGGLLKKELDTRLENASRQLLLAGELAHSDQQLEKNYYPAVLSDIQYLEELKIKLEEGSYDSFRDKLWEYQSERLKSIRGDKSYEMERIKALRSAFKDMLKTLKTEVAVYPEKTVFDQCVTSCKMGDVLARMIKELVESARSEKIERRVMDFSDLSHFTFDAFIKKGTYDMESGAFEKTPLAQKLTDEFTEIFIDEYQDTNLLQDTLFNAISNGHNLFMVGDIKQSIYRFRGADPSIFRRYKDGFEYYGESDAPARKIFLSENFRSNGGVLDFVNLLFEKTMNIVSPNSYIGEDMLVCTKDEPKITPELHIFEKSPRGEGDAEAEKQAEWEYIAARIIQFVNEGYDYSDIAVLARGSDGLLHMKQVLDKYDIPCVTESRESLFDKSEILMMLCILNTIDNPARDIYLIGAMTSPFFGFTSDELYKIRLGVPKEDKDISFYNASRLYADTHTDPLSEKISAFEQTFARWRQMSAGIGVGRLISTVYNDISILSLMNDKSRTDNLLTFYDFAKSFEAKELKGLFMFLSYVGDIIENGFSQNVPQESGNAVRLMTMHKSKGLEFPVCFVAGLNKKMNMSDVTGNMIIGKELGVTLKHTDPDGILSYDTLLRKTASFSERAKMQEEEMRLLYVALTRAQKHLILTACITPSEADPAKNTDSVYDIKKADSHYDMIASVLKYDSGYMGNLYSSTSFHANSLGIDVWLHSASGQAQVQARKEHAVQNSVAEIPPETLIFEYKDRALTSVPQKLSVSQLHLGLSDDTAEPDEVRAYEAPFFVSGKRQNESAAAGTAMHTFVQFCDYDICAKKGCEYEAERLLREAFITQEQYEMLDFKKLDEFFHSSLYQKIKASRDVRREMRFNILVDGSLLNESAAGSEILIQGVIDCFFENPDGTYTVVDFKTDRVKNEQTLIDRHRTQLEFYSYAVSDMTQKPVKETVIYSFTLSREIKI